jgi:hypothetical protein
MLEEEILRKPDLAQDKLLARMRKVHTFPEALRTACSLSMPAWRAAAETVIVLGSPSVSDGALADEVCAWACPVQPHACTHSVLTTTCAKSPRACNL